MDFGKLPDISRVDFRLPADHLLTENVLAKSKKSSIEVYVGCPVWSCEAWVGSWYPPRTQSKDFLKYYAQQFNTIELNTTHYRIPDLRTVDKWRESTPAYFRFCPKIPQVISHDHLLQDVALLNQNFCENVYALGNRLGICFLQLPPYFAPDKLPILENYIKQFPPQVPLSVEFRHEAWFAKRNGLAPIDEATQMLESYGVSTVICDVAGRRDVLHQRLTTTTAVIRFVGNNLHPTDYSRIDEWVHRIQTWIAMGLEKLYFFVHEPDNILSPDLSLYFIEKINQACNLHLKLPISYQKHSQIKLF